MNYWAQRFGAQTPQAPPPPAPVSNRPWWQPGTMIQVTPQQPTQPVQEQPGQVQQMPQGEVPIEVLLSQQNYSTTKAQSAKDAEACPDCGSGNYMRSSQAPNSLKQCFDCGFNARFLHSTHGASGIGQKDLPIHTARSQVISENNFNPQTIVGRV